MGSGKMRERLKKWLVVVSALCMIVSSVGVGSCDKTKAKSQTDLCVTDIDDGGDMRKEDDADSSVDTIVQSKDESTVSSGSSSSDTTTLETSTSEKTTESEKTSETVTTESEKTTDTVTTESEKTSETVTTESEKTTDTVTTESESSVEVTTTAQAQSEKTETVTATAAPITTTAEATVAESTSEDPYQDYTVKDVDADTGNRVEQVQGCLPDIYAVFYYNGPDGELQEGASNAVQMVFNGHTWQASELHRWSSVDEGINYYVLVDTSGSVREFFDDMLDGIRGLVQTMNPEDTITIYAVGDETEEFVAGIDRLGNTDADVIEKYLDTLSANAEQTYLNDAIADVAEHIQEADVDIADSNFGDRNIMLVFSDGENDSNTGKTTENVENLLENANVPLYAFMEVSGNAKDGNAMEGLAQASGGESFYVGENKDFDNFTDAVSRQTEEFQNAWIAKFAQTDGVVNIAYTLDLRVILSESREIWKYKGKSVTFQKAQEDTEAPYLVQEPALENGSNSIVIQFSEFVLGAETVDAYKLVSAQTASGSDLTSEIPLVEVTIINYTDHIYRLNFGETIYKGTYTLSLSGITDLSGNLLADAEISCTFDYALEPEKTEEGFFVRFWWIFLIIFLVILTVILLIVFRVIKKNKGLVVIDDKAVLAGNTNIKQHIVIEQQKKGQPINLYLQTNGKMIKKIESSVQGSVIIGRSDLCDIYIDDAMMSRQHFAIEYDGESFYIQDLDTTNGTMLNGIRLKHKRRLENGDRITAGSLDIIVRW